MRHDTTVVAIMFACDFEFWRRSVPEVACPFGLVGIAGVSLDNTPQQVCTISLDRMQAMINLKYDILSAQCHVRVRVPRNLRITPAHSLL